MKMDLGMWIFGYGSLVWRPDFPFTRQVAGEVRGVVRRFWQGSTDHRGTEEEPGRVVTLVDDPAGSCFGVAFEVAPHARDEVLARLDHREKGGYERRVVQVFAHQSDEVIEALVYIAAEGNENWLGPASVEEIARTAATSVGPSGPNRDYVLRLAHHLRELGGQCEHVFEVERHLLALVSPLGAPRGERGDASAQTADRPRGG